MRTGLIPPSEPRAGCLAAVVVLGVLTVLAALTVAAVAPPSPAPSDVPSSAFSAVRAFAHVERVAAQTHVTGSAANEDVGDYLVATLRGLGLATEVQAAVGASPDGPGAVAMADVRNVVALLPGTDPTRRLFLVAHYDSVQTGPGASDDAAGVSAVLEAVRALAAGPPVRNDIVVVFTDAEEACLCGAEAFAGKHPLAADGGVILNLEARGSGGPPVMFETSLGNAELTGVFGAVAPHPVATSVAVEVYRLLPNDTDFSAFTAAGGFTGLNSAYVDGSAAYHTPQDTPARLDKGSLQALGDNTLALARAFGNADLASLAQPASYDATYFPVLGWLVRYPGWLVWPFAVLAAAAVGVLTVVARRRGQTSVLRFAGGFGLTVMPLVLAPVAAQALWSALVAVRPGYAGMIDPWRPGWYRLAVVALVATVLLGWYALIRRRVGPVPLMIGALGWLAVLAVVLAVVAPGGSYLVALPALAGSVAGVIAVTARRPMVRLAAVAVGAVVAVLVLVPTVALLFPALGLATGAAPALLIVLLGLALLPVLELLFPPPGVATGRRGWPSWAVPAPAAGAVAVLVATGLMVDRFDAAHPVPTQLMYALDTDSGRARWVSAETDPGSWTEQYVEGREDLEVTFPILGDDLATGPATVADLPAPELITVADTTGDGKRWLTVRVQAKREVRMVVLDVSAEAAIIGARVAGREVPPAALGQRRLTTTFHAPPADSVEVGLTVAGSGPVTLRVLDGSDGLTELPGFAARPDNVDVAGSHLSDLVVVARTERLP